MSLKILVSAGEASGDRYAAGVVAALRRQRPDADFFGCTGLEMRAAGVRTVVDAASLSVVGLVEVLHHIPRIYGEYRKLIAAAERERPDLAILTDSPDFHLRLARQLHRRGIPVYYLVAPQAWAWREGRVRQLQRNVRELHCIFPFEENFFRQCGVDAYYIGHPLARIIGPRFSREDFFRKHRIPGDRPLITLCPGSRRGEIARHLPTLRDAVGRIAARRACTFLLAAPAGTAERFGSGFFDALTGDGTVKMTEGETWDAMAHSTVTLAASGTVTMEAALLGAPMVTFYKVTPVSWVLGKLLVKVPYFSMVNLVAGRKVVAELIQQDMTGQGLATETLRLLDSPESVAKMKEELAAVRSALQTGHDPMEESARRVLASIKEEVR
ncbi:lipid-A-disaccharide synthase [Paludibaculum fermentans]|uniref:Lipid-A-disaccharide synthase n=1 Tax=Paludibaculum fermentans TaxID=1473598 RepID=A0A7S7SGM5_PALFE|nr:lipid-A-disaccharide synthase [Paludibaculum fermentans]QOY84997.1 lipid-A-disaccharide synthase [Paludibaculum fermentans]